MFARSNGLPPLLVGMISSASGEPGSPGGNVLSTGWPHSQQCVSSCFTRATTLFRAVLLARRGFGLAIGPRLAAAGLNPHVRYYHTTRCAVDQYKGSKKARFRRTGPSPTAER